MLNAPTKKNKRTREEEMQNLILRFSKLTLNDSRLCEQNTQPKVQAETKTFLISNTPPIYPQGIEKHLLCLKRMLIRRLDVKGEQIDNYINLLQKHIPWSPCATVAEQRKMLKQQDTLLAKYANCILQHPEMKLIDFLNQECPLSPPKRKFEIHILDSDEPVIPYKRLRSTHSGIQHIDLNNNKEVFNLCARRRVSKVSPNVSLVPNLCTKRKNLLEESDNPQKLKRRKPTL